MQNNVRKDQFLKDMYAFSSGMLQSVLQLHKKSVFLIGKDAFWLRSQLTTKVFLQKFRGFDIGEILGNNEKIQRKKRNSMEKREIL